MPEELNHWLDDRCAKAYWYQHKIVPYQQLLADTTHWLEPKPGERWLDLGCGCGRLTAALWERSQGSLGQIVAMDCAAANAEQIAKVRKHCRAGTAEHIKFQQGNFSEGLPQFADQTIDGVVSGLAICYAEHRDPATGQFTDLAYNRLLAELLRILRPGGTLVFSVPVPKPRFWRLFWRSIRGGFQASKPARLLTNGLKMQRYGSWLHRETRRGRFHYYPIEDIAARLAAVGFCDFKYRLSFADTAYVVHVRRPELAAAAA